MVSSSPSSSSAAGSGSSGSGASGLGTAASRPRLGSAEGFRAGLSRWSLPHFGQTGSGFFDIPKVINGASDLMVEAFGDAGRHARSAVGVYRLPLNFSVEVEAVVEIS